MDDLVYLKRRLASANVMATMATSRCARLAYRDIVYRYETLVTSAGLATIMLPLTERQRAAQILPVRAMRSSAFLVATAA